MTNYTMKQEIEQIVKKIYHTFVKDAKTVRTSKLSFYKTKTGNYLSLIHISDPRDGATSRMPSSA